MDMAAEELEEVSRLCEAIMAVGDGRRKADEALSHFYKAHFRERYGACRHCALVL